jgi:hypothetical protein
VVVVVVVVVVLVPVSVAGGVAVVSVLVVVVAPVSVLVVVDVLVPVSVVVEPPHAVNDATRAKLAAARASVCNLAVIELDILLFTSFAEKRMTVFVDPVSQSATIFTLTN